MNNIYNKIYPLSVNVKLLRKFSSSPTYNTNYSCKLLVIGGGTGGCTMAAKFVRRLKKDSVIVLEPTTEHYYQPLWTLVGAGAKTIADTRRTEESVLPSDAKWLRESAAVIDPENNKVRTVEGNVINYEYLIVAVGLENNYCKVPGLSDALQDRTSGVSTIFSAKYCENTWRSIKNFEGGEAIFTFPDTLIKCPGAPQKIVYLADSYFNKTNVRSKTNISFNTALPVIFGIKKYADALMKVVKRKNINVNFTTVLKEVRHEKREAVFCKVEDKTKEMTVPYDLLHVSPPMRTPSCIRDNKKMVDAQGFLTVDKYTLQHTKYPNIYGLGDCIDAPNSKTAAAIAKQCLVVEMNLLRTMRAAGPTHRYDGYGACPLVTSYNTCIIAEFLYDNVVHETMPFNQATESRLAYYMKSELFPFIYWNCMLKGVYHGPGYIRRIINPFG